MKNVLAKSERNARNLLLLALVPLVLGVFYLASFYTPQPTGRQDIGFDISRQANLIVFTGNGPQGRDLYLLDLEKRKVTQLTKTRELEREPRFSEDGQEITYVSGDYDARNSRVCVYSLAEMKSRQINFDDSSVAYPAFLPGKSSIVFARAQEYFPFKPYPRWVRWDLFEINKDGTQLERLTKADYYFLGCINPVYEGKGILLYGMAIIPTKPDPTIGLFKTSPKTRPNALLTMKEIPIPPGQTKYQSTFSQPAVSPDGKLLACVSYYRESLCLMNINGKDLKELTKGLGGWVMNPRFSSDGKQIYYLTGKNNVNRENFELWRIDVTGKNVKCIADSTLFAAPLHWK